MEPTFHSIAQNARRALARNLPQFSAESSTGGLYAALCHATRGGGVLVMDGTGAFENCSFNGNSSNSSDNGGGVLVASTACASFKDCRFTGNVAGKGGAVYSTSQSRISLAGCDFSANNAYDGGAFYVTDLASASLSNCTFTLNRSGYGGAAGFEQNQGSYFAFTNCVFASNTATKYGGAVSCCRSNYSGTADGSEPKGMYGEFYGCTFTNNVASDCGGALFHRENNSSRNSGTPLILRNSLFAYNRVSTSGSYHCGGGIYLLSYDKPVVDSCTITCNDVTTSSGYAQYGAGFYNRWSCSIINTIIAGNTMNGELEGANDWFRNGASVTASHSCAYPAPSPHNQFTAANDCVTVSPKFAFFSKGDFTLRTSSPCKDTALLEPWMANALDLAGNARVIGDGPNMGCYEADYVKGMVIKFE